MIRQLLFLLLVFLSNVAIVNAQITEDVKSMNLGVKNALILELPDTKTKFVSKLWKKHIKDYKGKAKKVKKADELLAKECQIPEIGGEGKVDVYTRFSSNGDNVFMTMWVDLGDNFLASADHPDKYTEAEKFLMRFALEVTKEKIKIEIDKEEDTLKDFEKDMKKLVRANENYHRDIEQAKEKIKKAESNIAQNEVDQKNALQEIEAQKDKVVKVKKRLEDL